ncbi:MAG: hypothetical protein JWM58_4554 [Rhizobium sp.]|nr:hypothetical protein [Rhizobium sp.]
MTADIRTPLLAELDRWQANGRIACFWLRDDDAVKPTEPLDRLMDLTRRYAVPATLAVIPECTGQELANYLQDKPMASVAVHGWSHKNHAGENEKKQELGAHRPIEDVIAEIDGGFKHLQALYPQQFTPVLVPPWNRIAAPMLAELPGLGYRALSVFGPEKAGPLPVINTHVDLMDWHGTRRARAHSELASDIARRLRQMFETGGTMGLLAHHLVHDEQAWAFLDALFEITTQHPACRWKSLPDMLGQR